MNLPFYFQKKPVPLVHPEINPLNTYTNVLLIDNSVEGFQNFVDSVNKNTFPIVYSVSSLKTDLLTLLQTNFKSISRIGIVFTSSLETPKMFLDFKPLFLNDESVSENLQFIIDVINQFQVKNIDYLACNTLNYQNYVTYYDTLKTATGVIIGSSNNKSGNIKYGGDWIMESTSQDIEFIYFTKSIEYYNYLLDSTYSTGSSPGGIAIDSAGNIYTANYDSNNVSKITPAGVSSILGTTDDAPYGITIDSAGNIYTANAYSCNVSKITPAGITTILGTTDITPNGITIDSVGNIYTSNSNSNNVSKITPEGVSSIIGTTGDFPIGITIDSVGNIYTVNYNSNNVSKITPAGVSSILGTTGATPIGITIDSAGNIYTSNSNSNNVSKITPAGVSSILGTTGDNPGGITIDSAGNIYTSNYSSNNVTKITPEGVSTILGTTGTSPSEITIDSAGNIYTANSYNNTVTKITHLAFTISHSVQTATVSIAFSGYTITSIGPIASYSISPSLPLGLLFNTTTGIITGKPSTVSLETIYTITGYNVSEVQTFTLMVQSYPCFKEGSKILTDKGYIPIQDLRKGDLVKTLKHGFLQIESIGKREFQHTCCKERIKEQLYQCSNDGYPEVFDPLIITGCHSILVDDFSSDEQRNKTIEILGWIRITDKKYRLPACADHRASVYEKQGTYNIYHLALENADCYMNYGIYANGLLVETCSLRYLKELSGMELIED